MQTVQTVRRAPLGGNTATGALKLIALALMFVDHAGKMLFPQVPELRMLGRLAFPLYAWCMVVGFHYTRNPWRYALRILAVGLCSQPLYMLALNHTWGEPNIFLTLFLALVALMAVTEKDWERRSAAHRLGGRALAVSGLCLCLLAAEALHCDYGWRGVLLVVLLYAARGSGGAIAAVMAGFCLYWGTSSSSVTRIFGQTISVGWPLNALLYPWLRLQALAVLATPLMVMRWKRDIHLPVWVSYGLYPAHLLLLWLLEMWL